MEKILEEILCVLQELKNSNGKMKEKLTYTLDECAAISGIGKNTLLEETYKEDTTFPYFKVGRKIQVNRSKFERWLEDMAENHTELRGEKLKCVR
ncbi:helix-turn-helix domain-containing protein [Clostridium beijerinckii]|uniref:Flavin-dependent dehydrogenase n=1 Tax=Clostridium beijerinckii TaxID=1520 RepID=A0AAX0B4H9_CLOBE|nr:helix-turn-helix domain-containing protein [Clostridium beijerinckii]NRT90124.1 flavin-dependent dehydrogenase [Clostridium beijerinckii]NYC69654.1 flavin-dependent dehydrogenase [Clostridium beijerinckii]